ncbi:MAG TPA: hypothetical protein VE954_07195 [Oligoflexus sp.]|uniref:hypothetical protein n=1 Tax=Oligoflexus sp. TaxID=1971216 RepID=UPI002D69226A|nr:hypothetical protein [Oligoflexus sp.]HYX32883.1 hypothetical protein [Oligoflexus sp.]
MNRILLGIILALYSIGTLHAEDGDAELANRARGASAMSIQLMAADLLDELVYSWTKNPPLGMKARVALMGVSVPVGLNAQLASLLETHVTQLMIKNPQSGIIPVYCAACVAVTTYSVRDKTIIARGGEIPEISQTLKNQAAFALYIDIEGQGSQLVLRSYIVSLNDHSIVYARSLATDSSQPPSLRHAVNLVSADDARREYLAILEGRKRLSLSLGIRTSVIQTSSAVVLTPPFVWATLGFETFANHRKKWLADFQFGVASLKGDHNAWQLSSRLYRHLMLEQMDLIAPDVYIYAGPAYWEINGPGTALFKDDAKLTPGDIAANLGGREYKPKAHITAFSLGLEARLADFMRMGLYVEHFTNQNQNANLKANIHSYGIELGVVL